MSYFVLSALQHAHCNVMVLWLETYCIRLWQSYVSKGCSYTAEM